jgi:hypothetical protein
MSASSFRRSNATVGTFLCYIKIFTVPRSTASSNPSSSYFDVFFLLSGVTNAHSPESKNFPCSLIYWKELRGTPVYTDWTVPHFCSSFLSFRGWDYWRKIGGFFLHEFQNTENNLFCFSAVSSTVKVKGVQLHAMKVPEERGGFAPTHSQPRH